MLMLNALCVDIVLGTGTGTGTCTGTVSHWNSTPDVISEGYFRHAPSRTQNKIKNHYQQRVNIVNCSKITLLP